MNTKALRFQLLTWYVALVVAAFALFGAFMYFAVAHFLRQNLEQNLTRRAQQIQQSALTAPEINADWLRDHIANLYTPETSSRFIRITQGGTNVLYQSGAPHDASFDPNAPLPKSVAESFRIEFQGSSRELFVKSLSGENPERGVFFVGRGPPRRPP